MSLVSAALVVAAACGPTIHPAQGPGTAYPCGIHGKSCGGGSCCAETEICGGPDKAGFQRCPVGYCCDDPDAPWPDGNGMSSMSNAVPR